MTNENPRETLVLVGVFGTLSLAVMALRLILRRIRNQPFNLSDYLTMTAILCVLARSALTTVVLLWGNNNMPRPAPEMSDTEIYKRTAGSKLTMANRVVYNTYLWIQKSVVLLLCQRILTGLPTPERIITGYWGVLFASMVAVQVTTWTDCSPVHLYWQVLPDPGSCIQGDIELITLVALNVATDAMLILLPMPWLFRIKRSLKRRLQLIGIFSIGLLVIAIAVVRLPTYQNATAQVNRNTWGSVEEFFSAFVANAPTIVTLRKKQADRTNHASFSNTNSSNRPTQGAQSTPRMGRVGFTGLDNNGILVTDTIQLSYSIHRPLEAHRRNANTITPQTSDEALVGSV
ncbi:hypothetical protein BGW36DRAFT_419578 [Talaromyces proteolyticus]|uniref:Rhodopsin domain-containing protein n=1 Tax=Talaromyces proteolyticus TaxID=1131652 RepID=A0AAD4KP18_9EURO|nr:uncharacterized protein BGW36DRAFT_419578 [Talaromyces proteolyticus]KAH8692300.1 hypothetical protein BGW36DRAFT_419578 [Talaromyces proteolyticus]